jgi:hypothetical protein
MFVVWYLFENYTLSYNLLGLARQLELTKVYLMARTTHNGGEDCTWCVVSGKPGLAHALKDIDFKFLNREQHRLNTDLQSSFGLHVQSCTY